MPTVAIEGQDTFEVESGKKLVLAIEDSGYDILHRCGGVARCTTCKVHFLNGEPSEMNPAERETLTEDGLLGEYRLSCQVRVTQDMTIDPPDRAGDRGIPAGTRRKTRQRLSMPDKKVALLYDETVLKHRPPEGHPERPARVQAVMDLLRQSGILGRLTRLPITPATRAQLELVHAPEYLDFVEQVVSKGGGDLDAGDTVASAGSWQAATAAAGASIGAVDAVLTGGMDAAFAVVRPPGHHAPPDRAMGFCIVNNAAVAAAHAVEVHGLSRVLLVDFDVHHGNGTQDCFYNSPEVLYFSTHQSPAYPFTGAVEEAGSGTGIGYTVNIPLPPDVGEAGFSQAFDTVLRPLARRYQPELVIASAGYDAHWRNSRYVQGIRERLTVRGLAALSQSLQEIADAYCPGRLVGILEGGYDLEALAYGVLGTLRVWLGDEEVDDPLGPPPTAAKEPDITALSERVCTLHRL